MTERVWLIEESSETEGSTGHVDVDWHINPRLGYFTDHGEAILGREAHRRSEHEAQAARMAAYNEKCERVRKRAVKAQRQGFMVPTSEYPDKPTPLPEWRLVAVDKALPDATGITPQEWTDRVRGSLRRGGIIP